MPNVKFNEQQVSGHSVTKKNKGITGLVIKAGLAKNEKTANIVLVVIMILSLSAMFFMLNSTQQSSDVPPEDTIPEDEKF